MGLGSSASTMLPRQYGQKFSSPHCALLYRASLRLIHLYVMIYAIDSEIKTSISPSEMIQSKQTP